jgi:hypothetical protein
VIVLTVVFPVAHVADLVGAPGAKSGVPTTRAGVEVLRVRLFVGVDVALRHVEVEPREAAKEPQSGEPRPSSRVRHGWHVSFFSRACPLDGREASALGSGASSLSRETVPKWAALGQREAAEQLGLSGQRLPELMDELAVERVGNAHRAASDAEATGLVWWRLLNLARARRVHLPLRSAH